MGSGWFDCTEPPLSIYLEEKQGVQGAFTLYRTSSIYIFRVLSHEFTPVASNQPEPMLKNSTHFAISAMMWFKKVRGGSMRLDYTELVRNYPSHLDSPLNMEVR